MEDKNKTISPFDDISVDAQVASLKRLLDSHTHDGRETRLVNSTSPTITSGTAAPTTTPKKIGDMYVKTDTGKVYISAGTSSSSDWKILN